MNNLCLYAIPAIFRASNFRNVLLDIENLQRHFIDTFGTSFILLRPLLTQFQESLAYCEDCDGLRNSYVLNPINDGDQLGAPSVRQVS